MKMKKILCSLLAFAMIMSTACFAVSANEGTTYYVAVNGDDANIGTQDEPFASVQAAVNAAQDGDTVIVTEGNYNVFCPVGSANNYTGRAHNLFIGKNITVKGEGNVKLYSYQENYTSTFDARITVLFSGSDGAVLDGVKLYPAYYPETIATGLDTVSGSNINDIVGADTLKFYYNQIVDAMRNYNGSGKVSENYIANITIQNCTIGDEAIDPELWGSAIYYPGAVGSATNFVGLTGGYKILNNVLYGGICICEGASKDATSEECIISGNTLYDGVYFNGCRPTGWNYNSVTVFPQMSGNTFYNAIGNTDGKAWYISSRDGVEEAVLPLETLKSYIANNTFVTDGMAVKADVGSYAYSETATEYYALATPVPAVAKIGDSCYASLQDAVDNAYEGAVIELLADVELSENNAVINKENWNYGLMIPEDTNVTLDLKGNAVTYGDTVGGCHSVAVFNLGDLTIQDSGAELALMDATVQEGKISYLYSQTNTNYNQNHATILNAGKLTVNSGIVENLWDQETTVSDAIDNNSFVSYSYQNDAVCTINGGTIYSKAYRAIRQYTHYNTGYENTVIINDGDLYGLYEALYFQHGEMWYYPDAASGRQAKGKVEINGGRLEGGNYAVRFYGSNPDNPNFDFAINGGEFDGVIKFDMHRGTYYLNGTHGDRAPAEAAGSRNEEWLQAKDGFITGGKFLNVGNTDDVTTNLVSFLASDVEALPTADGGLVIMDAEYVAEEIAVEFENVTADDAKGEMTYNINLVATDNIINRLNAVDLTFALNQVSGHIDYEIVESNADVDINNVNNLKDRYEFHYKGKTGVTGDTAGRITIGQVKFIGYGVFDFAVADADTNVAHATTYTDNIVDTFVPGGILDGVEVGEFDVSDDTITGAEIVAPTSDLIINIDFPNAVENKIMDYQKMTVTVTGEDINDIVIDLGSDTETVVEMTQPNKATEYYTVLFDGGYRIEIKNALTQNTAYDIKVEGAGYRTARYTVNMQETDSKTVNFWNNVKDADADVEAGKFQAKKNFLAGDIVKDNNINVYDLSAVVSYFGETELVGNNNAYAKYDLNRDGFIDSKDVAMVLVSWNN